MEEKIDEIKRILNNIINKIEEEIKEIYYYLFLSAPVESFGCCSRYIEYSDAKNV